MFNSFSYFALQEYWWCIISLLGALLVFLMFVQGGQMLIFLLGKSDQDRTIIINALGRKWEFAFTTLVTFGGALFASFPLFYSTSFGGAYWVWMIILFCFIVQAVSYEYRMKPANLLGSKTYEWFLIINGFLATIFIGITVGTFYNGAQFMINSMNLSHWKTPYGGMDAIFNFHNVALGFSVFFLSRVLGALYLMNSILDKDICSRCRQQVVYNAIPFLFFFIFFLVKLSVMNGFAYDPNTKYVFIEKYKYLHNLFEMPVVGIMLLVGILLVLMGIVRGSLYKKSMNGIWFAGSGTILTVMSLLLIAGLNYTSFYPSIVDLQSSLTIENASSSKFTLTVMSYVSLFVPFVVVYIWIAWRSIDQKKINSNIDQNYHVY